MRRARRPARGRGTTRARRHPTTAAPHAAPDQDHPRRDVDATMSEIAIHAAERPADGLLHRHDDVHRLQGLRGRLQAVERPARRRRRVPQGRLLRPHRRARRDDLAPRALRRDSRRRGAAAAGRAAGRCPPRPSPSTRRRPSTTRRARPWVFMSDVCKHCTNAGCLDACPTGALIRTEFETVVLQPDVCNGCGYCIPSCPFGVVDRDHDDGRAAKCTLCYDRLEDGLEPAARRPARPTRSSSAPYDELVERRRAARRALHERGVEGAYLYGAGDAPGDGSPAASARSSCSPSRPSATGCPPRPTRRSRRTSSPATARRASAPALAGGGVAQRRRARRGGGEPPGGRAAARTLIRAATARRARRARHDAGARHARRARRCGARHGGAGRPATRATGATRAGRSCTATTRATRVATPRRPRGAPRGPGARATARPSTCRAR